MSFGGLSNVQKEDGTMRTASEIKQRQRDRGGKPFILEEMILGSYRVKASKKSKPGPAPRQGKVSASSLSAKKKKQLDTGIRGAASGNPAFGTGLLKSTTQLNKPILRGA